MKLALSVFLVFLAGLSLWHFSSTQQEPAPSYSDMGEMLIPISPKDLLQKIKDQKADVTLVNVWASWCPPCIEELPALVQLRNEYKDKGLHLVLYSADRPGDREEALMFLKNQNVSFTNYFKGDAELEEIETLFPDWEGALPISIVFDSKGEIVQKWMGTASYDDFKKVVEEALNN